ncbi:MAG: hypothetical protein KGL35_29720 [Bradyrhizobium sp.]|uniref:hypothetical protein n=1 Tax=Bradyrhizobium sp. TaxID=376 RepID=UPI001C2978AF|nr:hypothetical protein [Bradyrhizobium sp.]MBU6464572.1 hypothetical protein [Pseudomonadota bacterium]MDE2069429.1 hypothetical protein [Bradyrhizobium sp.]MDE2472789.1 hypothetical protein [Bradyrhizobium sp.]
MDKAQASEIEDHLLYVAFTLEEAIAAVSHLPSADQEMLTAPLHKLLDSLHSDVFRLVYEQHPSSEDWPGERLTIVCDLRWKEVTLPDSISAADLDAVILSKLKPRSLKVAKVITDVGKVFEERGLPIDLDVIGARIRWLDDVDRIESFGDVRKWRHSEIALKA